MLSPRFFSLKTLDECCMHNTHTIAPVIWWKSNNNVSFVVYAEWIFHCKIFFYETISCFSGAAYKNEWIWSKYNQFLFSTRLNYFNLTFSPIFFLLFYKSEFSAVLEWRLTKKKQFTQIKEGIQVFLIKMFRFVSLVCVIRITIVHE